MGDFKPNHKGVGDMLCAPFMVAEMRARAEQGKVLAEVIAPVDETGPHPGRYKESFEVAAGVRQRKTRRAHGTLRNTSPEAVFVEYVNGNHVLAQALEVMAE